MKYRVVLIPLGDAMGEIKSFGTCESCAWAGKTIDNDAYEGPWYPCLRTAQKELHSAEWFCRGWSKRKENAVSRKGEDPERARAMH